MQQTAIFGPVFAMVFLTLLVWVYMYIRRLFSTLAVSFIAARAMLHYLHS